MHKSFTYIFFSLVIGLTSCEKVTTPTAPFLTNAVALQNDSTQQFNYTMTQLANDSLKLNFQAFTNSVEVPGLINFYLLYTDTMDTLWLNNRSNYTYSTSTTIGNVYTLDTSASNYVIFQSNNIYAQSSRGAFFAQFIISDTIIDSLSPDTMRIDSGSFSGDYFN